MVGSWGEFFISSLTFGARSLRGTLFCKNIVVLHPFPMNFSEIFDIQVIYFCLLLLIFLLILLSKSFTFGQQVTIDFLIDFLSSAVFQFSPKPYVLSGFVDDFNTVLTLISSNPLKSAFWGQAINFTLQWVRIIFVHIGGNQP